MDTEALDRFFAQAEDVLTDWDGSDDAMHARVPTTEDAEALPGASYYEQAWSLREPAPSPARFTAWAASLDPAADSGWVDIGWVVRGMACSYHAQVARSRVGRCWPVQYRPEQAELRAADDLHLAPPMTGSTVSIGGFSVTLAPPHAHLPRVDALYHLGEAYGVVEGIPAASPVPQSVPPGALLVWHITIPPIFGQPPRFTCAVDVQIRCAEVELADRVERWRTPVRELHIDARSGQVIPRRPLAVELAAAAGRTQEGA